MGDGVGSPGAGPGLGRGSPKSDPASSEGPGAEMLAEKNKLHMPAPTSTERHRAPHTSHTILRSGWEQVRGDPVGL